MSKITPFLWFDNNALEAAQFYCSVFKDSKMIDENPMVCTFELNGQQFMALNGGPQYKFNEAVSFFVSVETQEELDYFWEKLSANLASEQCGWLKDKFGLSWQIVPTVLGELMGDPDREKANRVLQAMLKMKKLEIEGLKKAYDGV